MKLAIEESVLRQWKEALNQCVDKFDSEQFTTICELEPVKEAITALDAALTEPAPQDQTPDLIESLRQQLAYLQEELGNPPTDWHRLRQQLAAVTTERDELVAALEFVVKRLDDSKSRRDPARMMEILNAYDVAKYALAKLGADKTGEQHD